MFTKHMLSADTGDGEINLNPLNKGLKRTRHKVAYRNAAFHGTGAQRIETKQQTNDVMQSFDIVEDTEPVTISGAATMTNNPLAQGGQNQKVTTKSVDMGFYFD